MNSSTIGHRQQILYYLFTLLATIGTFGLMAQNGDAILQKLSEEDQESLKALVMYPEETREAIFIASQQPAALIKMKKIQERTADSFNEVIATKDKDTQKALWDITRYPNLVEDLSNVGPNNESRAVKALQGHPEIIRTRALQMYDQQFAAVAKIASLRIEGEGAFHKLMKDYSPRTAEAMNKLLGQPEILGIMTESMDVTVTVGDMYRQDPEGTMVMAAKLNEEVAAENAKELNDWRERLENDPDAMEEFTESTEEFLKEHEEDDVYYSEQEKTLNGGTDKDEGTEGNVKEVHHYYHYSYPYWFGYPRWYYYPRWRPYPWRYDWGWSFNIGWGGWSVWGMPSFYYMNWYFGYPYHYYNYPGLACHFSDHYYRHRSSLSSVSTSTGRWHQENKAILPSRLNPSDPQSREAVKQLGRMETDRAVYNRNNPENELSKTAYLSREKTKYPVLDKAGALSKRPSSSTVQERDKVGTVSKQNDSKRPANTGESRDKKPVGTNPSRPKIQDAKDQHRSGWNKQRTTRPSTPSRGTYKPAPSKTPSKGTTRPSGSSRSGAKGSKSTTKSRR